MPIVSNGGFCCKNNYEIYDCYSVFKEMKKDNLFLSKGIEEIVLQNPFHEFSHTYINSLTDKYGILTKYTHFFDEIRDDMMIKAYPYDTHIINEHIIRALVVRFITNIFNDIELSKEIINYEKEDGFIYIETIIKSLEFYENNRDKYKTINDFYPIIIKNMEKIIDIIFD